MKKRKIARANNHRPVPSAPNVNATSWSTPKNQNAALKALKMVPVTSNALIPTYGKSYLAFISAAFAHAAAA